MCCDLCLQRDGANNRVQHGVSFVVAFCDFEFFGLSELYLKNSYFLLRSVYEKCLASNMIYEIHTTMHFNRIFKLSTRTAIFFSNWVKNFRI